MLRFKAARTIVPSRKRQQRYANDNGEREIAKYGVEGAATSFCGGNFVWANRRRTDYEITFPVIQGVEKLLVQT